MLKLSTTTLLEQQSFDFGVGFQGGIHRNCRIGFFTRLFEDAIGVYLNAPGYSNTDDVRELCNKKLPVLHVATLA